MRYLFLLAAITLSGCGQKGALYLPKDTPKPAQAQVETITEKGQPQG